MSPSINISVLRSNCPSKSKPVEQANPLLCERRRSLPLMGILTSLLHDLVMMLTLSRDPNPQPFVLCMTRWHATVTMFPMKDTQLLIVFVPVISQGPDKPKLVQSAYAFLSQTTHYCLQCGGWSYSASIPRLHSINLRFLLCQCFLNFLVLVTLYECF